jgi:Cu-Zn family superoxide dismutase
MRRFALVLALSTLAGTALAAPSSAPVPIGPPHADIVGADGKSVGTATFFDGSTGVLVSIEVKGLPPGWHGMHFHAVGDCSDAGFQKSGAHLNHATAKKPHGLMLEGGPDFGDLPNLWVAADGSGKAQVFSTLVSWKGAGGRPALSDADGSALVIHASPDDQITQPIGGAGARIACAVVK